MQPLISFKPDSIDYSKPDSMTDNKWTGSGHGVTSCSGQLMEWPHFVSYPAASQDQQWTAIRHGVKYPKVLAIGYPLI